MCNEGVHQVCSCSFSACLTSCCHHKKGFLFLNQRPSATHIRREKRDYSSVVSQLYCFNFLKQVICYSLDVVSLHPSQQGECTESVGVEVIRAGIKPRVKSGKCLELGKLCCSVLHAELGAHPSCTDGCWRNLWTQHQSSKAQFLSLKALVPCWFTQENPRERNPSLWCILIDSSAWLLVCMRSVFYAC